MGGVCASRRTATAGRRVAPQNRALHTESGRGWRPAAGRRRGAFSTLLRQTGLRASTGGVLATKSERKMLASTFSYSPYAWLVIMVAYEIGQTVCPVVSSFFFSLPNLSGRRLDICHTSTHGVALVRI